MKNTGKAKSTSIILSGIVLLVFLVSYASAQTTNTSRPRIIIDFAEEVNINLKNLEENDGTSHSIIQTPLGNKNTTWVFRPSKVLRNSDYAFLINASDYFGNSDAWTFPFTVDAPFAIVLLEPEFGHTPATPYDVLAETTVESHCSYSFLQSGDVLSGIPFNGEILTGNNKTYRFDHTISNADFDNRKLWFKCRDLAGNEIKQDYNFVVDTFPPVITASGDPNPVIDPTLRQAEIILTTDDPTVCWLDNALIGNSFPGDEASYQIEHRETITYDIFDTNRHEITYNARCMNKAGLNSTASLTIVVELGRAFQIEILNPANEHISDDSPKLTVRTPIVTICEYKNASEASFSLMPSSDQLTHDVSLGSLPEGSYDYDVKCTSSFEDVNESVSFTIDRTAPTNVSVILENEICSLSLLEAEFTGTDENGLDYFNYTVKKGNEVIIPMTKTTGTSVAHSNLTLTPGAAYTWTILAVDVAGNQQTATLSATANDPNATECDTTPPLLNFNITNSSAGDGADVRVICTDSGSGCKNSYNYSVVIPQEVCQNSSNTRQLSQTTFVPFNQSICVWVSDNNGNIAFKKEDIGVENSDDNIPNSTLDTISPSLDFSITDIPANNGINLDVICTDDLSGCKESYDYSIVTHQESCTSAQNSRFMTSTLFVPYESKICVWVSDNNNNTAFKEEEIGTGYVPDGDSCGNNQCEPSETCSSCAIDCGTCGTENETIDPLGQGPGNQNSRCGNAVIDPGEDCDGSSMGGYTQCADIGLPGGRLTCSFDCRFDTASCSDVSDNFDPGEESNGFAWALILIGILMALCGGGYIAYKKYYGDGIGKMPDAESHPELRPSLQPRMNPIKKTMQRMPPKKPEPSLDKIREMERRKLIAEQDKKKKQEERKKLFEQFDEKNKDKK